MATKNTTTTTKNTTRTSKTSEQYVEVRREEMRQLIDYTNRRYSAGQLHGLLIGYAHAGVLAIGTLVWSSVELSPDFWARLLQVLAWAVFILSSGFLAGRATASLRAKEETGNAALAKNLGGAIEKIVEKENK